MISMDNKITNRKIGGPGHIVKIDECKKNEESCIQFLFEERQLNTKKLCSKCNKPISNQKCRDRTFPHLHCKQGHAKITVSSANST
jgi:hypothetical protein